MTESNPLSAPSTLPYGLADFAAIKAHHFAPALRAAMAQQLVAVESLATNPEPPTVANTLEAWDRAGADVSRINALFQMMVSADCHDDYARADAELAPEVAAHQSALFMHEAAYARFIALREIGKVADEGSPDAFSATADAGFDATPGATADTRPTTTPSATADGGPTASTGGPSTAGPVHAGGTTPLTAQDAWYLDKLLRQFERAGVGLAEPARTRLREIGEELAGLESQFSREVVAATRASAVIVTDEALLAGLPQDLRDRLRRPTAAARVTQTPDNEEAHPAQSVSSPAGPAVVSSRVNALPSAPSAPPAKPATPSAEPALSPAVPASPRAESPQAESASPPVGPSSAMEWAVELSLPTLQPILSDLDDRELRDRIQQASESRGQGAAPDGRTYTDRQSTDSIEFGGSDGSVGRGGSSGNADTSGPGVTRTSSPDTRGLIVQIARLRAEQARLLGFAHHAAFAAAGQTIGTTARINDLLSQVTPLAVAAARREGEELQALLQADTAPAPDSETPLDLRASDWSYYAERVRRDRFGVDFKQMRPFLELENVVRDGVFFAAQELFGISFAERHDLSGYNADVHVFEVFDSPLPGIPDSGMGLFLADWFTRPTKQGGAWMENLIFQNHLGGERPIVVNNLNIVKPPAGSPTLLTWDEVITLFHEFGHALHGLLSDVKYRDCSGPEVPQDFVEFPSQVNEMWAWDREVLASYAKHWQTGEPMPTEWIDKLIAGRQYGEGFQTSEYIGAALLDQAWHQLAEDECPQSAADVLPFEQRSLVDAGFDYSPVPPRYRSTYFRHAFESHYSGRYYAYIFSEMLDAETVEWYQENGGLARQNGERFRREILAIGGSLDPLVAFRNFRGHDARIDPLLKRRGLT